MKSSLIFLGAALGGVLNFSSVARGMNVMSMIDGVELNVNDYVEVQNFNQPTVEYVDN